MKNTKIVAGVLFGTSVATCLFVNWIRFCAEFFQGSNFGFIVSMSPIFLLILAFAVYEDLKA